MNPGKNIIGKLGISSHSFFWWSDTNVSLINSFLSDQKTYESKLIFQVLT